MHTTADETNHHTHSRATGVVGGIWSGIMGILPHVLHHVGPLAGAALIAGTTGRLLFGALTFVLTMPLLVRVHRKCGSWRIPGVLLGIFIAVWTLSTFVAGPWVEDQLRDPPAASTKLDHEEHHDEAKN